MPILGLSLISRGIDFLADPHMPSSPTVQKVSPRLYEFLRRYGYLGSAYVGSALEIGRDVAHCIGGYVQTQFTPDPGRRFVLDSHLIAGGMDPVAPVQIPELRMREATPEALVLARLRDNAARSEDEVWKVEGERVEAWLDTYFKFAPQALEGAKALVKGLIELNRKESSELAKGMEKEEPVAQAELYRRGRRYEQALAHARRSENLDLSAANLEWMLVHRDAEQLLNQVDADSPLLQAEEALHVAQIRAHGRTPLQDGEDAQNSELSITIENAEALYFKVLNQYISENGLSLSARPFTDLDQLSDLLDSDLLQKIEKLDSAYLQQETVAPPWQQLVASVTDLERARDRLLRENYAVEKNQEFREKRAGFNQAYRAFCNTNQNARHLIAGLARIDAASQALFADRERVVAFLSSQNDETCAQAFIQAYNTHQKLKQDMKAAELAQTELHNTHFSAITQLKAAERARKARDAVARAEKELNLRQLQWVQEEGMGAYYPFLDTIAQKKTASPSVHERVDLGDLPDARRAYFQERATVEAALARNEEATRVSNRDLWQDYDTGHRALRYQEMRLQLQKAREEFEQATAYIEETGDWFTRRALGSLKKRFDRLQHSAISEAKLNGKEDRGHSDYRWSISGAIDKYQNDIESHYLKQYELDLESPTAAFERDTRRDLIPPNRAQEAIVEVLFNLSRLSEGVLALAFGETDSRISHRRFSVMYPAVASNFTRRSWFEHRTSIRAFERFLGQFLLPHLYMYALPYSDIYDPRRTDLGLANVSAVIGHHGWSTVHRAPWFSALLMRLSPRFVEAAQHQSWFGDFITSFFGRLLVQQGQSNLDPNTTLADSLYGYGMPSGKEGLNNNPGMRWLGLSCAVGLWMNPAVNSRNPQVAELESVRYTRQGSIINGRARAAHSTTTYYPLTMEVSNWLSLFSGLPGELLHAMEGPFTNFLNGGNSREMRMALGAEARSGRRDTLMRLAVQMGSHSIFPKPDKKLFGQLVEMTEAVELALPAALEQVYTQAGRRIPQDVRDLASTIALRTTQLKSALGAEVPLEMIRNGIGINHLGRREDSFRTRLHSTQEKGEPLDVDDDLSPLRRGELPQDVTLEAFRQMARVALSDADEILWADAVNFAVKQLYPECECTPSDRALAEIRLLVRADRREFEQMREYLINSANRDRQAIQKLELAEFLRSDAMSAAIVNTVVAQEPEKAEALYRAIALPAAEADGEVHHLANLIHRETQRRLFDDAVKKRFSEQLAHKVHWRDYTMDRRLRQRLGHLSVELYQENLSVIAQREAVLTALTQDQTIERSDIPVDWIDYIIDTERSLPNEGTRAQAAFTQEGITEFDAERLLVERFHELERVKQFYDVDPIYVKIAQLWHPEESSRTRIETAQQALVVAFDADMDRRETAIRTSALTQRGPFSTGKKPKEIRLKRAHDILHPELLRFGVVQQLAGHLHFGNAEAVSSHVGMLLYMVGEGVVANYQDTGHLSADLDNACAQLPHGLWQSGKGIGVFMGLDRLVFAPLVEKAARFIHPFISPEAVFRQGASRVVTGLIRGSVPAGLASMAIAAVPEVITWWTADHSHETWSQTVDRYFGYQNMVNSFVLGDKLGYEFLAGGPAFALGSLIGSNLGRAAVLGLAGAAPGVGALCVASVVASVAGLFVGSLAASSTRTVFNGAWQGSGDLEYYTGQQMI